jgi:hypothetical protein
MRYVTALLVLTVATWASDQKAPNVADSGSFAISVNGKRVAVEKFSMKQGTSGNSVSSTLEFDDGKTKAHQQAELEMGSDGSFRKYTWQEMTPGKARITAEPQDKSFITVKQKGSDTDNGKENVHPLDINAISIIDTNFYSHVEVMMWKYMALSCREKHCAAQKLPIFVPYQEMSQLFTVSYTGNDYVPMQTGRLEMSRFKVQTENGDMDIWMDGFRIMKLRLPGAVEVVRE